MLERRKVCNWQRQRWHLARSSIFNIPLHVPFADALASGLLAQTAGDPASLSRMRILLPNRRAVRAVTDAFLRHSDGRALLMPRLQPIGDVDAGDDDRVDMAALLDPALAASAPQSTTHEYRILTLAPLVQAWLSKRQGKVVSVSEALATARPLLALLDQLRYAGVDRTEIAKLVGVDLAEHWQTTLEFLDIILRAWPQILHATNRIDPAEARVVHLTALAERWRQLPPSQPIIAAGTTGTVPAVAALLKVIASLPQGQVILPGLDTGMDDEAWDHIKPTHPQFTLKTLLATLSYDRRSVLPWPASIAPSTPAERTPLIHRALLPAEVTARWRLAVNPENAFEHVKTAEANAPQTEARLVALAMRRQLETPGATAALVTPDRALARRVAAQLRRYGLAIDDSAGQPMVRTALYAFFNLIAECGSKKMAPVAFLGLAKHPLTACGLTRSAWLEGVRLVDKKVLRGPRPAPGLHGLKAEIIANGLMLDQWYEGLSAALTPWCEAMAGPPQRLEDWLVLHIKTAEALAATDENGLALWKGDTSQILSNAFSALIASAKDCPLFISAPDYAATLQHLLAGVVVRPAFGTHPRLFIWGPLEARLQRADLMILGSLNEGSWPPAPEVDPFLNDAMRATLGLPTSDYRIGQSALDFAQGLSAASVLLTRSKKSTTAPLVASRFWQRLQASLAVPLKTDDELLAIAERMDVPRTVQPAKAPQPAPPLSARPRDLYVTDIELWRRNPYALYAKKILRLRPLDDIDAEPGARERGTAVHEAFEAFMKLPEQARTETALLNCGNQALAKLMGKPEVRAFWWPRFEQLAKQFMAIQATREDWQVLVVEVDGHHEFRKLDFIMRGRADRIDINSDRSLDIIDYKSGQAPRVKEIEAGFALQLPLLGLLASCGGFKTNSIDVKAITVWPASVPRDKVAKAQNLAAKISAEALICKAHTVLEKMVDIFSQPQKFYNFDVGPQRGPNHDYDHLARVDEWRGHADG